MKEAGVGRFDMARLCRNVQALQADVEEVRAIIVAGRAKRQIMDKLIQRRAETASASDQPDFAAFLTADGKKGKDLATVAWIKDPQY